MKTELLKKGVCSEFHTAVVIGARPAWSMTGRNTMGDSNL
jgi:hypothetical protein